MEQKICLDTDACIEIANNTRVGEKILYKIENVEFLLRRFNKLSFDDVCAKEGSEISKELAKKGKVIDFRDIFIAATCIINKCSLLTLNLKHFKDIKGLKI